MIKFNVTRTAEYVSIVGNLSAHEMIFWPYDRSGTFGGFPDGNLRDCSILIRTGYKL